MSVLGGVHNFVARNIVGNRDDDYRSGLSVGKKMGLAGAWAAGTTAVGYAIGHEHQVHDVVTHSQVPYPETVTVQTGTHMESGGFHYHYSFMDSKYEYSYDPLWDHEEPTYETHETGRTLYRDVAHHTVGWPYTAFSGAAVGLGVGVVTGALAVAISEGIKASE